MADIIHRDYRVRIYACGRYKTHPIRWDLYGDFMRSKSIWNHYAYQIEWDVIVTFTCVVSYYYAIVLHATNNILSID